MSEAQPLLRLDAITRNFGAIEALRGVSFEIARGEVVITSGDKIGVTLTELVKSIYSNAD